MLEESNFNFRYVRQCDLDILKEKMAKLLANSGDPDQTPHSAASELGLHCLPITLLGVSRLQWVNYDVSLWRVRRPYSDRTHICEFERHKRFWWRKIVEAPNPSSSFCWLFPDDFSVAVLPCLFEYVDYCNCGIVSGHCLFLISSFAVSGRLCVVSNIYFATLAWVSKHRKKKCSFCSKALYKASSVRIANLHFPLQTVPFSHCPKITKKWIWATRKRHIDMQRTKYSRLSLSRTPRDSPKYFEISVVRHIRFAELRKK